MLKSWRVETSGGERVVQSLPMTTGPPVVKPFEWSQSGAGPLRDVRILDFTHGLAGPFCTQMFAYFGAEVIKVESAARPDRFREGGQGGASPPAFNRIFAEFSRNKRDITINMKSDEGRALVRRLLSVSDIVAENFSAGVLKRWGLTYPQIEAEFPHLIVVSMPGMGSRGPYQHWITWGASLLAFTGMTWMWGYPDQADPIGNQIAHPDYVGGILGAIGALAALEERKRSGQGQAGELPQVAGAASLLPTTYLDYFVNHRTSPKRGNSSPDYSPYGIYACKGDDRWCVIAVTSEAEWGSFCAALGNPAWAQDARFTTMASRVAHRDALDAFIADWTGSRSPHAVMDLLQAAGVAAGGRCRTVRTCSMTLTCGPVTWSCNNPIPGFRPSPTPASRPGSRTLRPPSGAPRPISAWTTPTSFRISWVWTPRRSARWHSGG